jgi:hypothetical protein
MAKMKTSLPIACKDTKEGVMKDNYIVEARESYRTAIGACKIMRGELNPDNHR